MSFWRKKDDGRSTPPAEATAAASPIAAPVAPTLAAAPAAAASPPPARTNGAAGVSLIGAAPAQVAAAPVGPTPAVDAAAAAELSPEAKRKAADASKAVMAAFGQITSVLMRSAHYKHQSLADLEWMVVPALMTGQFSLAEAQSKANGMMAPIGVLLWASVSHEVDQRLSASPEIPTRLAPTEWRSGDILWVIDAVGEPQMVQAMLKRMSEKDWQGRPVKMKARDKDGAVRVGVLAAARAPGA